MGTFDSLISIMDILFLVIFVSVTSANEGSAPVIKEHPSNAVVSRNEPLTLKCAASGTGVRITWFHDGQKVIPSSHRVLLEVGNLFFLRVSSGKRQNDAGTYWCVASNLYGSTRSNNASLMIATLSNDFQEQPEPLVKANVGDSMTLHCRPPKGYPIPEMAWLRDGHEVTNSSRITVTHLGDLIIAKVVQEDTGEYVCRAHNVAGNRQSTPSKLVVRVPPWFEKRPANLTTAAGMKVELACRANGLPTPSVTWRRLDGKMPLGRATIEDQKLVLQQVATADSGTYVCEAESEAGTISAKVILNVVNAPHITQKPQNVQVLSGEKAQISCHVEGDPKPLLMWRLPTHDRTNLLMASQTNNDSVSLSQDGQTLIVDNASADDSGPYYCWGVSNGGGISAQAELVVVKAYPPPVVGVGPQDIMVAPGGIASFQCEVVSEAATPSVSWWYRPAAHLPARHLSRGTNDERFSLPDNGALIIKDVRADDSGIYTCKITASTGKVEQEAIIRVTEEAREPLQIQLPAPPTKPRIISVNTTAVHLTWLPNSRVNSDSGGWYTVEYWRHGWEEWRVADAVMSQESCLVTQLTPGQVYTFLVRAVNARGASFPSPWSDPILTRPSRDSNLTIEQVRQARRRLSRPTVTLSNTVVTGADSVKLTWKFLTTAELVEGVLAYAVAANGEVQMTTILGSSSSSHLLRDLQPNSHYTFFIVPFWQSVEGTPSNSYSLVTPEDVPNAAPEDVRVTAHEDGSTLITWSPLSATKARGEVIGYQVTLTYNGTQSTQKIQSPWLEAHGLVPGRLYTVRVAALTGAGVGPFSAPVLMDAGVSDAKGQQDMKGNGDGNSVLYAPPQPAWLVYLLVPLIIVFFIATLFYVQRLRHKAPPSNPPNAPALYQDPSIYPAHHSVNMYSEQKLWRPQDSDKDSSMSSSRLLHSDPKNEYAEPREPRANEATEPYATTTLLAPDSPRLNHGIPWKRHHSDDSGVQVNWSAFLPPPPACPPPRDFDLGTPTGSVMYTAASQYDNLGGSQQYKKPCDATSEHTYDVYTQVTPMDHHEGFLTFNTLQGRGCHKLHFDCKQKQAPDPPRSNTH